ncbi:hypothetical protein NECAME_00407 [Necator americanus]|uniref:Peptidase A1 domain-containing protein n=1 Tax=Necator americanus TaxID=51031 RepID=W2TAG7_NECAM|nr:hypothetical protein NECAME_00407 [Necator americanus]ETN79030.1 hypothetical protein NECAME_00407 [Necator americanus]
MIQMMRKGTWRAYVKEMEKRRVEMMKDLDGINKYSHEAYNYFDMEFLAVITVGNPEQKFLMIPDTGSSAFWVPDITCMPRKRPGCEAAECDFGFVLH